MAETRQLSVRLPDDVFAGLERIRPEGVSLAEVARAVIAKVVLQPELPSLEPAGTRMQRVDLSGAIEPVLEAIAASTASVEEMLEETLRAVHDHGHWMRHRIEPKGNEILRMEARDAAVKTVREWKVSVQR